MNIGLDYDGVCTSDMFLFQEFAKLAKIVGHKIYLVTMRYPSECHDVPASLTEHLEGVFATSRMAKKKHMEDQGINIHVWIDDHPEAVHKNATEIWGPIAPEGQPVVPSYN